MASSTTTHESVISVYPGWQIILWAYLGCACQTGLIIYNEFSFLRLGRRPCRKAQLYGQVYSMESKQARRIKQLCCLGIDGQRFIPILLPELRNVVPSRSTTFLWVDNEYHFENFYDECPDAYIYLPNYLSEFLENRDLEARPSLESWLRVSGGVIRSEDFYYRNYKKTDFYNTILHPLHYHQELIVGIKDKSRPRGILFFHRSEHEHPFQRSDVTALQKLMPFIAYALSKNEQLSTIHSEGRSGALLFNGEGDLEHISTDGIQLLILATHPFLNKRSVPRRIESIIPLELLALCQRMRNLFSNHQIVSEPPIWRHKNRWGVFTFEAHWLNTWKEKIDDKIIVTIKYQKPLQLRILEVCDKYKLSTKQSQIAIQILSGRDYTAIANQLHISRNTVVDHVRKMFNKTGAHNRQEFLQKLAD